MTEQIIPRGYKKTDVGVIFEDWEVKKLGSMGVFKKGRGIKKDSVLPEGLPCIRYGEIYTHHNEYLKKFNSFISIETAKESQRIKEGDLLFAGSGETAEEIGKCVAYLDQQEAYAGGDVIILSPFENNYDSKYLGFLLNAEIIVRQKAQVAQGDAIVHIYPNNLAKILLPLPATKKEQTAIAIVLSDTDDLIRKLDDLILKKRNIKQGAMQELFTGKKRLPGFSGKWGMMTLGQIGKFRGGSGFPIIYQGKVDGQYPFFKVSDMNNEGNQTFMITSNNWIADNIRKQMSVNTFPRHSIVFAKIGAAIFLERKKILSQESCVDNNMMGFMFDENIFNYRFLHYLFLTIQLGKLVSATALPSLNGREIAGLKFSIPDTEEQSAISQILSDMDAEIEQLEQELDKYKMIKQGMMQELLTGRTRLVVA